ncbi:hypothetical protein LMG27952_07592 [Paraburkholderia hiiakae]|uniref:Type II toxin-antitoxin system RelE/ParE family toxin n=1 Tax=Paraburkholderia hiiakae TaxID=1081782 RepID=A0ABN7IFU6_9BURK|nr:hypothetical protein LMG27952_07592 [Paraburkholderia hiiakae]
MHIDRTHSLRLTETKPLDIPGLRSCPLDHYPHLIFYIERKDHVEVWRVLNGKRDTPAWMSSDDSEFH